MTKQTASLTAGSLLLIALVSNMNHPVLGKVADGMEHLSFQNSKLKQPPFEIVTMADVTDKDDGTRFALNSYRARGGAIVNELHGSFEFVARAEFYYEKDLSRAVRVGHTGTKKDKKGKVIGKRAQIVMRLDEPPNKMPAVLWTSGTDFFELYSNSASDMMLLEKQLTP